MTIIEQAGRALYGERWHVELADALDVSDRTLRRLAAGGRVPQGILSDLHALCEARGCELAEVMRLLKQAA